MDIMLDETGDLAVSADGDLLLDYSTGQEAATIIHDKIGDWKQHPLIGVGIDDYVKRTVTASMFEKLKRAVRVNFESDNKTLNEMMMNVDEAGKLLTITVDCE